ncbi:hypothetical protein LR48_Vigan07g090700 [Vigna angularis]|uniref:DUF8039 domain-containing protein n=1 Tax=Phaseolus angularis TaxID=3914 RepID=A0A0L9UWQ3_PHAAN|nr:hypothetical protein LR48_Vigan07g090700 [Vigna angularis]
MAEPPHSSRDEVPTTSRRIRGATRLRQLILRRNAARDHISILTPSFDHVSEADRNLIWQDLLMTFDMPNVESLRSRTPWLSRAPKDWHRHTIVLWVFLDPSSSGLGKEYEQKLKEEIRKEMTQEITKKQSSSSISCSGTCCAPTGDDMDDTRPCQLYIFFDTGTMLVARGTVYETTTVVHGVQLAKDEVKVTVDEVVVPDVVLHVPTDEFFTVQEAFKSFVALPRHLKGQEGSLTPKKTHLSEDDPLRALDELANIISDASMIVEWDSTTFGREAQIPLYLHQQDVGELASGREEINITLIQLWMMYMFDVSNKKGFNDVYEFIDPSMTHERNKFDDIQTYITTCFAMGKEIYFLPYILGRHWQLLVISIPENTDVWFCSLHKSPPIPLRHVVDW